MANRYWVGGTGTWSGANTANWSTTSGGTGGASVPGSTDIAIFDTNSNTTGSGASYTVTFTAGGSVAGIQMDNPSAGTLTFTGSTGIQIGSTGLTVTATVNCTWTGNITYTSSGILSTNGNTISPSITVNSALVTLGSTSKIAGTFTFTNGGFSSRLATNGYDLYCSTFVSTASGGITPQIDATNGGVIYITSTTTGTVLNNAYGSFSLTGPVTFNLNGAASGTTRTVVTGSTRFKLMVSAGNDTVAIGSSSIGELDLTGFSGTLTSSATVGSHLTIPNTVTAVTGTITVNGLTTSTSNINITGSCAANITTSANTFNIVSLSGLTSASTFTQGSGTVSLNGDTNMTNAAYSFGTGTLNLNGYALTVSSFTSSAANTRTLNFGTTGVVNCSMVAVASQFWTPLYLNNGSMTYTGSSNFNLTGNGTVGTRVISVTGAASSGNPNITVSAGSDAVQLANASATTGGTTTVLSAATIGSFAFNSGYTGTTMQIVPYTTSITIVGDLSVPQTSGSLVMSYSGTLIFAPTTGTTNLSVACPTVFSTTNNSVQFKPSSGATTNVNFSSATTSTLNFTANGAGTVSISALKPAATFTHTTGTVTVSSSVSMPGVTYTQAAGTLNVNAPFAVTTYTHNGGTVTLADNMTVSATYTLAAGTINLNNFTLSCAAFASTATATRTLAFGTSGIISITGTSTATVLSMGNGTNLTVTGTSRINISGAAANGVVRTLTTTGTGWTESNALSIYITGGATGNIIRPTTPFVAKTFSFADSLGSILDLNTNTVVSTIYGSYIFPSVQFGTAFVSTVSITFASTQTGNQIKMNGMVNQSAVGGIMSKLTFGVLGGGEWILQDNLTQNGSYQTLGDFTLTNGTLNLNGKTVAIQTFSSNTTNNRGINFGTTGQIALYRGTTTATIWETSTTSNMTITGTPNVRVNMYSGSVVTMNTGSITTNPINVTAVTQTTGGTQSIAISGNIGSLDLSGITTATTWASVASSAIYGSMTLNSFITTTGVTLTFKSTRSGNTITTSTANLGTVTGMVLDGVGGEWILQDNFTGSNAIGLTITNGTLNLNNKSFPLQSVLSNNSNVRGINFGSSGSISLFKNTGTIWTTTTDTNLSLQGTPKVNVRVNGSGSVTLAIGSNSVNPIDVYLIPNSAVAGATVNMNGSIGTLDTTSMVTTVTCTSSSGFNIYRNLNLNSFTTFGTTTTINFKSSVAGAIINPNGATMTNIVAMNFSTPGSWTFNSAMTSASNVITQTAGTLNTNGYSISASSYNATGSNAISLSLGSSSLTLSGTNPWNLTGSAVTFNAGTSTITCTNVAPTFNGIGLNYYNLTFSNGAVTSININGANTYNNLSFATPTTAGYVPVTFSANQNVTGAFIITGTTVGNFRLFFKSSVLDTQRTITAASVTNLSDVDFRDIVAAGASAPWSGTRIGNAGNNSNITFTAPKNVWFNNAASGYTAWSSNSWALSSGGTVTPTAFPLPQDTVVVTQGSSGGVSFTYQHNVGNVTFTSGGGIQIQSSPVYFMGDLSIIGTGGTGDARWAGTVYFYNRSSATQTFTLRTAVTSTTGQMNGPMVIDTNGTVQFSNMSFGSLNTPYNKQLVGTSGSYISHIRGSLVLNDTIMTIPYYDSSFGGNTRSLDLGTATTTFSYASDNTKGFVVQTSGYTLTPNTSTVAFSGATFGLISDGNLTFNNLSITNMSGITTKLIASKSYANNESTLTNISISANNMTVANNGTGFSNSWLQFSGISAITLSGTLTFTSGNVATQRITLVSIDTPVTISAATLSTMTDVDFSGITASGASAPWSGTRIGNAGRNTNINADTPKTLYWASGTGTFNWYSLGWTNTPGGGQISNLIPLAQDTVIINDTQPSGTITFNILNNFALPTISFTGRTTAVTMSTAANMLYPGNLAFFSGLTWSGSGTLYFTGDTTQTVNTSGKSLTQVVRIASNGSVQLQAAATITNTSGITLTGGDLNLNGFTLTTPVLTLNTPLTKSMTFGSGGSIAVTGNALTVVSIPQSVNNSITSSGTSAINLTYSGSTGTRTVDTSGISSDASALNINVTAGADILSIGTSTTNSGIGNFSTQGFTGTWVHQRAVNLYGNLTVGTGVTTIQDVSMNYVGSGFSTLTTNGKTIRGKLVVNSNGGSLTQQDALTLTQFGGGAISYLQLLRGTYAANNFAVNIDRFSSTGSLSRTLSMGTGTWTVSANDDTATNTSVWEVSSSGSTIAPSTSTIALTGTGTKTFKGGSKTYNNLTFSGTGSATNITNVTGANIFNTVTNSTQPQTITFESNASQSFTNFNLSGTAGNLISLSSNTALQATLYKASAWNVGTNSVDGGGNSGLSFTAGSNDYLRFTNINGTNTAPLPPAIYFNGGISLSGGYSITF